MRNPDVIITGLMRELGMQYANLHEMKQKHDVTYSSPYVCKDCDWTEERMMAGWRNLYKILCKDAE